MPAFDSDWKNAEDTHYLQTLRHRNHLLPQDNSDILPDKVHISDTLLPNTDDHALSDLDVSDFPDEGEQEAADQKEAELDELVKSPGWRAVW